MKQLDVIMTRQRESAVGSIRLLAFSAGMLISAVLGPAWAGDPLNMVPSNVAGVIAFRHLEASSKKLEAFIKTAEPDFSGLDLAALERALDLEPGVWDAGQPVVLILTQPSFDFLKNPEFSETHAIMAFTPKDPQQYRAKITAVAIERRPPPETREPALLRRIDQGGRSYYAVMRDDVVFVGGRRKAMRALLNLAPTESLLASLDEQQKTLWAESDLFVHLPLARWRDKINMMALLASNLMKLGMTAEQDAEMAKLALMAMDWFGDGARSVIDQMRSVTVAVSFDGEIFRLAHHHAFRGDGSVADYLRQVSRSGGDLLSALPDKPFFLLGAFDWHSPPDAAVSVRFSRALYQDQNLEPRITTEVRQELLDRTVACYSQMRGTYLMLTALPGDLGPMEFLGGYYVDDSRQSLEQLQFVQQHSLAAFSPFGGGRGGKTERRVHDGQEYYDTPLDFAQGNPAVQRQVTALYGKDVRFQEAAVDQHNVFYAVTSDQTYLPRLLDERKSGKVVSQNKSVRGVAALLPPEPHALVVIDLGRLLAAVPPMVRAQVLTLNFGEPAATGAALPPPTTKAAAPPSAGPMLGWACVVRPTSLSGCLAITAKDAIQTAKMAKEMIRDLPWRTKP